MNLSLLKHKNSIYCMISLLKMPSTCACRYWSFCPIIIIHFDFKHPGPTAKAKEALAIYKNI